MKRKLLIVLLLIGCIPLVAASTITYYLTNKMIVNEYYELSSLQVGEIQSVVHNDVIKHLDILKFLAKMPTVREMDLKNVKQVLVEAGNMYPLLAPIVVDNASGSQMVKSNDTALLSDISARPFYQAAMSGKMDVVSEPLINKTNGQLSIVLATPIYSADQTRVVGVVQGTINLKDLSDFIAQQSREGVIAYIVDREGKILAHPNKELVVSRKNVSSEDFIRKGLQGESGTVDLQDDQGVRKIINYTVEPTTGWIIVLERPQSLLLEKSNSILLTTIIIILITIAGIALVGRQVSKNLTRPIDIILSECQRMAKGDLRNQDFTTKMEDEFGKLANGFQMMRIKLIALFEAVRLHADQVTIASKDLKNSAENSAQVALQIADSSNGIAVSAETSVQIVGKTSAEINQVSTQIERVATNANEVALHSIKAAEMAITGEQAVGKALDQMHSIEIAVSNSFQVVTNLGERSREIGKITDVIASIAGQTNLLALNAAIEAARAGEQGRGFAVVAEEVRKLAEQSQTAAKNITLLINDVQSDTDKAVLAMNEGNCEVKVGSEVVTMASQAFKEIKVLVTRVSEQMQEVSTSIQEMSNGENRVVNSIKEIDKLSNSSLEESQAISGAIEEHSASMEAITSASQNLFELAQGLKNAVEQFRI